MKTNSTSLSGTLGAGSFRDRQSISAGNRRRGAQSVGLPPAYKHPWENRKALSEEYESEFSGREGWWRATIKETPVPGSYDVETTGILYELGKKPNTYRFKSDGRKLDPHPHGKGALLMPGAYDFKDFLATMEKNPATYNFKTGQRDKHDILNFGRKDKDINVSPQAYDVDKYMSLTVEKQPSKHGMFKSQSKRFPTMQFKPKEGPAPGNYESHLLVPARTAISSSFKSRTPRFASSHTRVPGPGSYEKTFQNPQAGVLQKMGRQHGLFFSSAFQA